MKLFSPEGKKSTEPGEAPKKSPKAPFLEVSAVPTSVPEAQEVDQFTEAELARLGLRSMRPNHRKTAAFSGLLGAVLVAAAKLGVGHADTQDAHPRHLQETVQQAPDVTPEESRAEAQTAVQEQEGRIRVEAHGMLEGIGMTDQEFATRTRQVFAPFLREGTYRFTFTNQSHHYTPAYFGIHGDQGHSGHGHGRGVTQTRPNHESGGWYEMASHRFVGEQGHDITLRRDGLDPTRDYMDIQGFWSNALHEVIHGLGHENKAAFEARVRSRHRIPYPYTEHFLDVPHGQTPDYGHMADEYRSKTYEMIFQVRNVPPGSTVEAEAVRVIRERFPGVSTSVVRSDVRAALSLLPDARWVEVIREYHELVKRSSDQFERQMLHRRIISQVPDAELAAQLSQLLDQGQRTLTARILDHRENVSEPILVRELVRDVREYHQGLIDGLEAEMARQHPELVPMLQAWKDMARFTAERGRFHRGQLEASERDDEYATSGRGRDVVIRPMTDQYRMSQFRFELQAVSPTNFVQAWNRLSPEVRAQIRPTLEQMARLVSHTEPLPPFFATRAEQAQIQ